MIERIVQKVWGRELWIVNTSQYCGKLLKVNAGYRCSIHYHKDKDETFYILRGVVLMEVNGEKRVMKPGAIQRITPEMRHRFTGLSPYGAEILEVSTHHEDSDSYREEPSGKIDLSDLLKKLRQEGVR